LEYFSFDYVELFQHDSLIVKKFLNFRVFYRFSATTGHHANSTNTNSTSRQQIGPFSVNS